MATTVPKLVWFVFVITVLLEGFAGVVFVIDPFAESMEGIVQGKAEISYTYGLAILPLLFATFVAIASSLAGQGVTPLIPVLCGWLGYHVGIIAWAYVVRGGLADIYTIHGVMLSLTVLALLSSFSASSTKQKAN